MTGQARERTRPPLIVALWALAMAAFGMLALATSGESTIAAAGKSSAWYRS